MPFQQNINVAERFKSQPETPRAPDTTLGQQLGAAFQLENILLNGARTAQQMWERRHIDADPTFDPRDHLTEEEKLVAGDFADAGSLFEMEQIRRQKANEREWRRQLSDGPAHPMIAALPAVVLDATSVLPFGVALKGGTLASKVARGAAVGGAENVAVEGLLHETQIERNAADSAVSITLGTLVGGGLGGLAAAFNRHPGLKEVYTDAVAEHQHVLKQSIGITEHQEALRSGTSVGAARFDQFENIEVDGVEIDPTELAPSFGLNNLRKLNAVGLANPGLELQSSRFKASRQASLQLVDTGLITKGNIHGWTSGNAFETVRDSRVQATIFDIDQLSKTQYRDFAKVHGKRFARDEFEETVGQVLIHGTRSSDQAVDAAAKGLRDRVFTPLLHDAQRAGLVPKDIPESQVNSYLSRIWKADAIDQDTEGFRRVVARWLSTLPEKIDKDEIDRIADGVIDKILGLEDAGHTIPSFIKITDRGPLKERTFHIPSNFPGLDQYIELNAFEIARRYAANIITDVEIKDRFGDLKAGEELARKITDEASRLADTNPKDAPKIRAEAKREAEIVKKLFDHIRGVRRPTEFKKLAATGQAVRSFNFINLLGGMTLSSLADVGRVVMAEGGGRALGTMLRSLPSFGKGIRMAAAEARLAGTALEYHTNLRGRALWDLGERIGSTNKIQSALDKGSTIFAHATLMTTWNQLLKSTVASMAQTRVMQTAIKLADGKRVSSKDLRRLAQSGISHDMAKRIAKQRKHVEEVDGLVIANTSKWTDQEAVTAMRAAIKRDTDSTIITPGAGDAPIWTQTEFGKTMGQFKRFSSAAMTRILIAGAQQARAGDISAMGGAMTMLMAGFLVTTLKEYHRDPGVLGGEKDLGDIWDANVDKLIGNEGHGKQVDMMFDIVDRSGVGGLFFEFNSIANKFAGVSIQGALGGGEELSRFASRGVLGQALGPTAGLAERGARLGRGVGESLQGHGPTQGDVHAARMMLPFQNLIGWNRLFNMTEEQLQATLPKRRPESP